MNIIYYAFSLDNKRLLGEFDATASDIDGTTYRVWIGTLSEPSHRYVNWPDGEWFRSREDSAFMDPVKADDLPKELQMRLLIGALT
jgi:hypothetical protein